MASELVSNSCLGLVDGDEGDIPFSKTKISNSFTRNSDGKTISCFNYFSIFGHYLMIETGLPIINAGYFRKKSVMTGSRFESLSCNSERSITI